MLFQTASSLGFELSAEEAMNVKSLEHAPTGHDYLTALQAEERSREFVRVTAGEITMADNGRLRIADREFEVDGPALKDLARHSRIPLPYLKSINCSLRAVNFNARLSQFFDPAHGFEVVSNDNRLARLEAPRFGRVTQSEAVEQLLDSAPPVVNSNSIRAIEYQREGRFEVALVTSDLSLEPLPNDVVLLGVHLTIDESGAVQVGAETFRLICLNGAMARACVGERHMLRRGKGVGSREKFVRSLRELAKAAWNAHEQVRVGLASLAGRPLGRHDLEHVVRALRTAPFFISRSVAERIRADLQRQSSARGGDLTFLDLHNAITAVGTHDLGVLPQYRYRLRLGAGQLARGRANVCPQCQRLVLAPHSD